ncbi:ABC transporter substrate-binding protein [Bradyrhizobium sp. 38]|uniref:ABC transporter substrate-binding protein n=1 Tax=unclassified Bradyrhizobium TaxID=2631580 RepID=UPI001FFAB3E1|nr:MULTISPECIES: ABC transporter substrate-binding protein [unclassified Bradyrhizobium]MCK1334603.1 ABC transporter substrate-binding protein [Bradyrhizobium sp. 38]MCK1778155.1 ABC transporter substrate-binding protein [Bradyrhizobium sp. 132]
MQAKTLRRFFGSTFLSLMLTAGSAWGQATMETPKYGGALEISTVYANISALSFDNYDWPWKHNHDTGAVYEQLLAGDLSQAKSRGGSNGFTSDAYIPSHLIRGELAEKWEWLDNPLRLKITLRNGVMFPEKQGVMAKRELVADDVVFNFKRIAASPKAVAKYFDFVKDVRAEDRYTVVFEMSKFNAEWDYRFGYGYYSGVIPKEVVDAGAANWKNVNGTGPFKLADYVQGSSQTYEKNPDYWDKEKINDKEFKLPYVDKVVYRIIKDETTRVTALRTGKLDIMEYIRWQDAEQLKKSAPDLKWNRRLATAGTFLSMRVDQKPFDDIRVRRAMNMAVNKEEIIKTYYNGNAELFAYPQHPDYTGYFQPLNEQPASVQELFKYDPAKAKKLLVEAGYPNGFTFKAQVCSCSTDHADLISLVAAYLEQVGVKMEIQPMEYGAFLSAMTTRSLAIGYFMDNGHTSPTTTIRKSFMTGQTWNPSQWSDPKLDERMEAVYQERDESRRQAALRTITTEIVDKAPYLWLPTPYVYTAWWPWLKGYAGELRAGAERPGPIYARMWIDQDLKRKMGY